MATPHFIFLDEGGDLGFTAGGSRFFSLTCLSTVDPMAGLVALSRYRYECLASPYGLDAQSFHCSHDIRVVRQRVFEIIAACQSAFRYDALIVEKRKTHPKLQAEERFYPEMLGYLLRFVIKEISANASEFVIITDELPVKRKRRAIDKAVRSTLAKMLPENVRYRLAHHSPRAHHCLQMADYVNWAIFRKWERAETQFHGVNKPRLASEFEIFNAGQIQFY